MTIDLKQGKAGTQPSKTIIPSAEEIVTYLNSASPDEIEALTEHVATTMLSLTAPSLKSLVNAVNTAYRARQLSDLASEAVVLIAGDESMLDAFCSQVRKSVGGGGSESADGSPD
jgi:hypothetical protein